MTLIGLVNVAAQTWSAPRFWNDRELVQWTPIAARPPGRL
jgi:hypothetical protein